ncbi:MAG TPA: OmpA family protein [Vicinamibacterales bacterium]|nr:OmpA family protein [Vicinamibacterales bacterium]HOQ61608.1 OmpA family protein [Vicinamibacterales bacterium]HPK71630.1 OmpA family protein [Vicinamibacterales bacterium]
MFNSRAMMVGLFAVFVFAAPARAQKDAAGCRDHPSLTRMPQYALVECRASDFDAYEFYDPLTQGKTKVTAEGRKIWLSYEVKAEYADKSPSQLQIVRNYETAIQKIGGKTYSWTNPIGGELHARYAAGGLEIFARVYINGRGKGYTVTFIEKEAMRQEVTADAKTMAADIGATGRAVLYGIFFDVDKAEVKPESEPALTEIARLLKQDPALKLYVVGHTDGTGVLEHNMRLSQMRAEAVAKELASKHGVAADRLKPHGVGPLAPVATNDTEEGKARNRRVELVKR